MQNSDECVIAFPVVGGIFGVARLATKLNELSGRQQIGPWRVGQRADCKHTDAQVNALGKKSPTFSRFSYLDQEGKLQIGNPASKFIRTILMSINTLIVSMGCVIGLVLGVAIGYIRHPFIGALFFACMIIGAWVQSSAFRHDGNTGYGGVHAHIARSH